MIIKFRLTASQFSTICRKNVYPIMGFCGMGEYKEETRQFLLYSLIDNEFFEPILSVDSRNKMPVFFLNDSLEKENCLFLVDKKIQQISRTNHFDVIGLSVWFSENNIISAYAHSDGELPRAVDSWYIVGHDIVTSSSDRIHLEDETQLRTIQAFGEGTVKTLSSMCVGVVGVSGTGSPLVEMLYRTGVGELVLVDPDIVENKNLNRILNTSVIDALNRTSKVVAIKKAISDYGFLTKVEALAENIFSRKVVKSLSRCDIIFGCTDTADSRALINSISQYYCIPYIDVGVRLVADGKGNVNSVCAAINYVMPDGRSLEKRGTITSDEILAATLKRTSPHQYQQQLEDHYIKGETIESPAVLCVNMAASSFAFLDFMSRIHSIRSEKSFTYERTFIDYTNMRIEYDNAEPASESSLKNLGRGDAEPLLGRTELSKEVDYVHNKNVNKPVGRETGICT